jgi:hypothetical protein
MSEKEKRIRAITKLYYSNPKIQEAIFSFAHEREVVPSYMMESFGKRPDALQYPSDIMGLVNKGATSFHCSEEIWKDPLKISSEMGLEELSDIRKSWDLLIDIDSPFLDYSKIAAKLIISVLESYGIKNYGLKFSGSKGFHIIVPANAFPDFFEGVETRLMFPEWPKAISEFLLYKIRPSYNKIVSESNINFDALKTRTNLSKEDVVQITCPVCGSEGKKMQQIVLECPACKTRVERKNPKLTKRKLKCIDDRCPGFLEKVDEKDFFECGKCGTSSLNKKHESSFKVTYVKDAGKNFSADFKEDVSAEKIASLDLVLVSSRHLFRMPYSLHEKTALASAVLTKDQIDPFSPRDANPLTIKVLPYYHKTEKGEAEKLLASAIAWKKIQNAEDESVMRKKYASYDKIEVTGVTEDMFPPPIKKLLKGLKDGKKRGLFILLTFLKSLNFSAEYINDKAREWNKKNEPPLKEGYIKSQIDWHLRQKRQILPPNYSNPSFYKDLNLLDKEPQVKNPVVEVIRKVKDRQQRP